MSVIAVKKITVSAGDNTMPICYRMHVSEYPDGSPRFGISVENRETGEISMIGDLTSNRNRADFFFERVVHGAVTPIHLRELAEDFAASI